MCHYIYFPSQAREKAARAAARAEQKSLGNVAPSSDQGRTGKSKARNGVRGVGFAAFDGRAQRNSTDGDNRGGKKRKLTDTSSSPSSSSSSSAAAAAAAAAAEAGLEMHSNALGAAEAAATLLGSGDVESFELLNGDDDSSDESDDDEDDDEGDENDEDDDEESEDADSGDDEVSRYEREGFQQGFDAGRQGLGRGGHGDVERNGGMDGEAPFDIRAV